MSRARTALKWAMAGVAVLIAVVAAVVVAYFVRGPSADELNTEADKLEAPAEWELIADTTRGPRIGCIDVDCPSLHWRWKIPELPTAEELQELMTTAGWEVTDADDSCVPNPNRQGSAPICGFTGQTSQGWDVDLALSGTAYEHFELTLRIEP